MSSEFLYGINTAEEILTAGRRRILRLVISSREKNQRINKLAAAARGFGIRPEFMDPKKMDRIAGGGNHQGVIIEAEPPAKLTLEEAISRAEQNRNVIWAALDGITDPMNLGAIIRSAACFGVSVILLPERRSATLSAAAQKAASGAAEHVDVIEIANLNQTMLKLKEKGFWIYGLDMDGQPLPDIDFSYPALITVGSEGSGIREKTVSHCDVIVSIPQKGGVQSLNAGIASAIAFYEASRKI